MTLPTIKEFLSACGEAGLDGEFTTTSNGAKYTGKVVVNADGSYEVKARRVATVEESRIKVKAFLHGNKG
tara:strand:- start:973 stop:1182 length:210 start_codon:yes stop_codon:yes gene_type:complete